MSTLRSVTTSIAAAAIFAGCASAPPMAVAPSGFPDAVKPPATAAYFATLVGAGELTYECRAKPDGSGSVWTFVGPNAALRKTSGETVGKYYGGPTWEANDGSKVVGKQLAVSPSSAGNIPLQLVEVTQSMGSGMLAGTKYIQRLNTVGGVAPAAPCAAGNTGAKQVVNYQADYAFYR